MSKEKLKILSDEADVAIEYENSQLKLLLIHLNALYGKLVEEGNLYAAEYLMTDIDRLKNIGQKGADK